MTHRDEIVRVAKALVAEPEAPTHEDPGRLMPPPPPESATFSVGCSRVTAQGVRLRRSFPLGSAPLTLSASARGSRSIALVRSARSPETTMPLVLAAEATVLL